MKSRTKYIVFFDADHYCTKEWWEMKNLLDELEKHNIEYTLKRNRT